MKEWEIWGAWHSYPLAVCPACKQAEGIIQCDYDYFFSCRRCESGSMAADTFKSAKEREAFYKAKKLYRCFCSRFYPVKGRGELDHKEW